LCYYIILYVNFSRFSQGESEKNYFEALKGNNFINKTYVLVPIQKKGLTDLDNAIGHSKKNEQIIKSQSRGGLKILILFFYDSNKFENRQSRMNKEIEDLKDSIYLSHLDFECFLNFHKTKNHYKNGEKPKLHRDLIKEVRNLTLEDLKKVKIKPNKYKNFKTTLDFLVELFEKKI
jgi:hypothetical protein